MTQSGPDDDASQRFNDIVEEIYDAVGDVERWRRLNERFAATEPLSHEIALHLANGRRAHERHVALVNDVEALLNVHDQIALGALLVDRDGRLLRANAAASRLLAGQNGLAIVDDHVFATNDADNRALSHAIERASSQDQVPTDRSGPFVLARRPGHPPLSIFVLGNPESALPAFEACPVTLLVVDPDVLIVPSALLLRELFGLTARESEFAELLMKGLSVEEAAQALGVGITTARSFLSQVTAKTDSHGQFELLQRLLAIPGIV